MDYSVFGRQWMVHWMLDGHTPVPIRRGDWTALQQWEEWFERSLSTGERQVCPTLCLPNGLVVSTAFLGENRSYFYPHLAPRLFQTRVFEGPWDDALEDHSSTWEEAETGHWRVVARLLLALPPFDWIAPTPQLAPPIYLSLFDERKVAAMSDDELGLAVAQFNELYRRNYLDPVDWAVAVLKQAMVSGLQPWQVCAPVAEALEELLPGFADDQKIQRHTT